MVEIYFCTKLPFLKLRGPPIQVKQNILLFTYNTKVDCFIYHLSVREDLE